MSLLSPYTTAQVSFEFKKEIGHDGKNSTAFVAHDKQLDCDKEGFEGFVGCRPLFSRSEDPVSEFSPECRTYPLCMPGH